MQLELLLIPFLIFQNGIDAFQYVKGRSLQRCQGLGKLSTQPRPQLQPQPLLPSRFSKAYRCSLFADSYNAIKIEHTLGPRKQQATAPVKATTFSRQYTIWKPAKLLGPTLAFLLITTKQTLAATIMSTVRSQKNRMLRPLVTIIVFTMSFLALIDARKVRRRQALDATSEWIRYASNPAARGRAILTTCLRFIPFWIKQLFCNKTAKVQLRTKSGDLFAESLLKLGPLYIKLGQIISCREKLLPEEWIRSLERLQDRVPARTGQEALDLAYGAVGSKERFLEIFSDFDTIPLAAASLGQVHKATLRHSNETVAIKLQRPFLRQIYDQDLVLLTKIARVMDQIGGARSQVGGVSQSWTQIFQDAKTILYREIDYNDEAENAIRFSNDFGLGINGTAIATTAKSKDNETLPSAASWLRSPYVYKNVSSEKVLVMEFVPSIKITNTAKLNAANVTAADKEYLADCLARAYLRSFCANRFFSTDPHPGNLGVEIIKGQPPRLVMYDFGQACSLQPDQAEGILDVVEAIVDMDSDKCVAAFEKMGVMKEGADIAKVRAKVRNNFETGKIQVKRKKLTKAGYIFKDNLDLNVGLNASESTKSDDADVMGFFTLPAEYAFVARAISQMDGVGKSLDPDFDFISSAAPYIVEVKGAANYISDALKKWLRNTARKVTDLQQRFDY